MFPFFRRGATIHLIDCGKVGCPVRGRDVDLDLCCSCQWLLEVDPRADLPFVRCQPELAPDGLEQFWV